MSSFSQIWHDKILQLSTEIHPYQGACDVRSVVRCRNLDITFMWQKNVEGIPHEVPVPNPAHTLVSACHKRRNIRSHLLTTCYGLHQKASFVSIHIARLTQGTPAHNALHCQVGLASGRSLGRDWRRRPGRPCVRWTDQLHNDTGSVPANLWRQTGHPTGPWWSDATARAGYAMTTTTTTTTSASACRINDQRLISGNIKVHGFVGQCPTLSIARVAFHQASGTIFDWEDKIMWATSRGGHLKSS